MSEKYNIKWIEHRGQKILFADFRNEEEKNIGDGLNTLGNKLLDSGKDNALLAMDITNFPLSKAMQSEGVRAANKFKDKIKAIAVVTHKEGKKHKLVVNTVRLLTDINVKPFDSREEAFDWLVEQ